MPQTGEDLGRVLRRIDGRGYKAYRDVRGAWELGGLTLFVDHVQGDPFAAPSRLRLRVPMAVADFPADLFANPVRRLALEDFLVREAARALPHGSRRGSGQSGLVSVDVGGQQVIERTACVVTPEFAELRVQAGLPAAGRRVLGREAEVLLCEDLPGLADAALLWASVDPDAEPVNPPFRHAPSRP